MTEFVRSSNAIISLLWLSICMNKNDNKMKILWWAAGITLILLAIGILVYFFVFRDTDDDPIIEDRPQEQTQEDQQQPEEKPDVPSDWATYTNDRENFRFRYPPTWFITTNTTEGEVILTNFKYPQENGSQLTEDQVKAIFKIDPNPSSLSASEWLDQEVDKDDTTILDRKQIEIDGETAVKSRQRDLLDNIFYAVNIPHNGKMYSIIWLNNDDKDLNTLIDSFEFTN